MWFSKNDKRQKYNKYLFRTSPEWSLPYNLKIIGDSLSDGIRSKGLVVRDMFAKPLI